MTKFIAPAIDGTPLYPTVNLPPQPPPNFDPVHLTTTLSLAPSPTHLTHPH